MLLLITFQLVPEGSEARTYITDLIRRVRRERWGKCRNLARQTARKAAYPPGRWHSLWLPAIDGSVGSHLLPLPPSRSPHWQAQNNLSKHVFQTTPRPKSHEWQARREKKRVSIVFIQPVLLISFHLILSRVMHPDLPFNGNCLKALPKCGFVQ